MAEDIVARAWPAVDREAAVPEDMADLVLLVREIVETVLPELIAAAMAEHERRWHPSA